MAKLEMVPCNDAVFMALAGRYICNLHQQDYTNILPQGQVAAGPGRRPHKQCDTFARHASCTKSTKSTK